MSDDDLVPYDLTADPESYVRVPPGWEGFKNTLPRLPPDHPARVAARRRWDLAAAAAGVDSVIFQADTGNAERLRERMTRLPHDPGRLLKRLAEAEAQRRWIRNVKYRLGLVTIEDGSRRRYRVTLPEPGDDVLREHIARVFGPDVMHEALDTDEARAYFAARREADAAEAACYAALRETAESIAGYLTGLLPDGMRFEWATGDEPTS